MKRKKKQKLIIFLIITLILVGAGLGIYFFKIRNVEKPNTTSESNNNEEKKEETSSELTGPLKNYLSKLGQNYSIKYQGYFYDDSDQKLEAIIEYTKDNENFAVKSSEIDLGIIYLNGTTKTVSDRFKKVITIPNGSFDISKYNLVSSQGQIYVKEYKENYEKKQYEVAEYKLEDQVIKYYFIDGELKLIDFNKNIIKIIRVDYTTNRQLFEIPNGYTSNI